MGRTWNPALADDAPRLPGVYAKVLRKECERRRGPDYRLILGAESSEQRAEFERHKADAAAAVEELFGELLAASEPVIADRWDVRKLPGAEAIPWLQGVRGPRDVLVRADDTVELVNDFETVHIPSGRILRNPLSP